MSPLYGFDASAALSNVGHVWQRLAQPGEGREHLPSARGHKDREHAGCRHRPALIDDPLQR